MAESAVARLLDTARVYTPGAMDGVLRLELFNVATEFCQRTDAWMVEVIIPAQWGVFSYALPDTLSGGRVNRLLWIEGVRPNLTNPFTTAFGVQFGTSTESGASTYIAGPPQPGFLLVDGDEFTLNLQVTPSSPEAWYAHVALTPCDPTDSEGLPVIPAALLTKYYDYFASGLISRLCAHPKKPYSDPQLAMVHGRKFESGMSLARREARTGYLFGGQRWNFPSSFRSGSQRMS